LGYDSASKGVSVLDSVQEDKGQIVSQRCCNCDQLENQLKVTQNELTSVKLLVEFLKDETEFLKQKSPMDFSVDTSWLSAKSRNSCGQTTLRLYKDNLSAKRSPTANMYAVPVANQYSALEKHNEPYEFNNKTSLSQLDQFPRFLPDSNLKYIKRSRRKKTSFTKQLSPLVTHYPIKPNLQESMKNENGSYNIPTIMNGVTSENYNSKACSE
jgi:hypothetical protein